MAIKQTEITLTAFIATWHQNYTSIEKYLLLAPAPFILGSIKFMDHKVVKHSLFCGILHSQGHTQNN
jgi:hypothetical protein